MTDDEPRWQPTPIPPLPQNPDGTMPQVVLVMDDDMRIAIFRRLWEDFQMDRDLTPEKARQLAQFGAASIMALSHELAVLKIFGESK